MKVLLLGATGNLGSRAIPALLQHKHSVVAFVRTESKIPAPTRALLAGVAVGNAKSASDIKKAIIDHGCDAIVNAAGVANMAPWGKSDLMDIFPAVRDAAVAAGKERGAPLRAWFLAGLSILESLNEKYMLCDYLPIYIEHKANYLSLVALPKSDLIWSMLCPASMTPIGAPTYPNPLGSVDNLEVSATKPPGWTRQLWAVPIIGGHLNMMSQAAGYNVSLEDMADLIAKDLEKGAESEFAYKRVGAKEKPKAA